MALLMLAAVTAAAAVHASAPSSPQPPAVGARSAVLYDPATGTFLYSRSPHLQLPVGSLTKLMTAWLALPYPADTPITAPSAVTAQPKTKAYLVPGRTYRLGDLLPVLIVHSANDAAVAIATGLAGSVPAFADRMNRAARALDLNDTHYVNPDGLDAPGQHSSAHDVAVLGGILMQAPQFRRLAAMRQASLGGRTFPNENPFLGAYPGADGIKTGFTKAAAFCLAASATRQGRRLIAVVLHEPSWKAAVADASALLDWGFRQPAAKQGFGGRPGRTGATIRIAGRQAFGAGA